MEDGVRAERSTSEVSSARGARQAMPRRAGGRQHARRRAASHQSHGQTNVLSSASTTSRAACGASTASRRRRSPRRPATRAPRGTPTARRSPTISGTPQSEHAGGERADGGRSADARVRGAATSASSEQRQRQHRGLRADADRQPGEQRAGDAAPRRRPSPSADQRACAHERGREARSCRSAAGAR